MLLLAAQPGVLDEAYELANRVKLGWLLELGLERARRHAPDQIATQPSRRPAGRLEGLLARSYADDSLSVGKRALLDALTAPPSVTARTLHSIVQPGDEYLAHRGRVPSEHLRHQLRRIWRRSS